MADRTRVVLYGSSLFMAGLALSLKVNPVLDVIHVLSGAPASDEYLQELVPAVIIFDLDEMPAEFALAQFRTAPGLLLIGVDHATEDILLLSGQQVHVAAVTDITRLIADVKPIDQPPPVAQESTGQ